MSGHLVDFIMSEYQAMKNTIQSICPDDTTGPGSLAVATLLMPLKLTTFNKGFNGHVPEDDKTDFIKELNSRIIYFNKQRSLGQDGSALVLKFDTRIATTWIMQVGVGFHKKGVRYIGSSPGPRNSSPRPRGTSTKIGEKGTARTTTPIRCFTWGPADD